MSIFEGKKSSGCEELFRFRTAASLTPNVLSQKAYGMWRQRQLFPVSKKWTYDLCYWLDFTPTMNKELVIKT